jgi:hypothetical protein
VIVIVVIEDSVDGREGCFVKSKIVVSRISEGKMTLRVKSTGTLHCHHADSLIVMWILCYCYIDSVIII